MKQRTKGILFILCALLFLGGCDEGTTGTELEPLDPIVDAPQLDGLGYNATPVEGERPLLVIVTSFEDTQPYDRNNQSLFFGEDQSSSSDNIAGLYESNSGGKFKFDSAGIVNVAFDVSIATAQSDPDYIQKLFSKVFDSGDGFRFQDYDTDGSGTTTDDELAIVVLAPVPPSDDDGSGCLGQTRTIDVSVWVDQGSDFQFHYNGSVSFAHDDGDISLYAHELFHQLDPYGEHIYGPGARRNYRASFYAGSGCASWGIGPYHLDPWFKMRLGWLKPRVFNLGNATPPGTIELGPADPMPGDARSPVVFYDPRRGLDEFFILEYRAPMGYDAGVESQGLAVWYVKHKSGTERLFRFNWPPPITIPESSEDNFNMFADYVLGVDGPGTAHFWTKEDGEFSLKWGDGTDTRVRLKVLDELSPSSQVLSVQFRTNVSP